VDVGATCGERFTRDRLRFPAPTPR